MIIAHPATDVNGSHPAIFATNPEPARAALSEPAGGDR
jgi:hypothetical protein